jgi:hypothetical protein
VLHSLKKLTTLRYEQISIGSFDGQAATIWRIVNSNL